MLYLSSICSGCASGILLLSLPWNLLQNTGRALDVGFLNIAPCLIIVAIMPIFSYFLDKFPTKEMYFSLLIFNIFILITFSLFAVLGENKILYFLIFCFAALMRGLEQVARTSFGQKLVNKIEYLDLNRSLELIRQTITLVSGILFAAFSTFTLFKLLLVCLFMNFLSVLFLYLIRSPNLSFRGNSDINVINKPEGFVGEPLKMKTYFLLLVLPYVAIAVQNVIYPSHIHDLLNLPKIFYALMVIPYALGSYLASYSVKYLIKRFDDKIFPIMFFAYCITTALLIVIPSLPVFYFALLLFPLLQGVVRIGRLTLLMKNYPEHCIARVIGYGDTAALIGIVILTIVCGALIDGISVIAAWSAILIVTTAALIALWNLPPPKITFK